MEHGWLHVTPQGVPARQHLVLQNSGAGGHLMPVASTMGRRNSSRGAPSRSGRRCRLRMCPHMPAAPSHVPCNHASTGDPSCCKECMDVRDKASMHGK
jgi:hypothetical protein